MGSTPPTIDPRDEAFLREVDDAYREDQLKQFFQRWWRLLLVVVGGGLAAVGAFLWWQADRNSRADDLSERFTAALDRIESGSGTEAQPEIEAIAQSGNASYRSLAALTEAGIALAGDNPEQAAARLKQVVDDPKAPAPIRDAATIRYVAVAFDRLQPAEALGLLQPYLAAGNPWFPVAGELAALAQMKAGKPDEAGKLFHQVASDDSAPPSLRSRAEQMAASLGEDMTELAAEREEAAAAIDELQLPGGEAPAASGGQS